MNYPPAKASGFPRLISFLVSWFIDLITLSVLPDTLLNASPCFCLESDLVPKPDKPCFSIFKDILYSSLCITISRIVKKSREM